MQVFQPTRNFFPQELTVPGMLAIQGVNRAVDPLNLGWFDGRQVRNLEPSFRGWNNRQIGVVKRNTNTPSANQVKGMCGYGDTIVFSAGGNIYTLPLSGGTATLATGGSGVFSSTAKIRMVNNQGTGVQKLYMCDGLNSARSYNGTAVSAVTLTGFTAPATVGVWQRRTGWTFAKGSVDENRILFSREENGDDYSGGAASIDSFDDYCFPGDGDNIVGFGTVQFKGQDSQSDALIVCKKERSFQAVDVQLAAGARTVTFNNNGVDVGAVSADAIIQFGNDLWLLGKSGIKGFNSVLGGSGGIGAITQSPVARLDKYIEEASLNSAFENAFALHNPVTRKIRFFMTESSTTNASQNGFSYPEIPNDSAICYGYGVLPQMDSNPRGEAYWTRGGAGFAFSSGCVYRGRTFLGDYFGNIYELEADDSGDDYIPSSGSNQIITSTWETGDWTFGQDFNIIKSHPEYTLHVRTSRQILMNFDFYKNQAETSHLGQMVKYSNPSSESTLIYGTGLWGTNLWGSEGGAVDQINIRPAIWGNSIRMKMSFPSKRLVGGVYVSNAVNMFGMSGKFQSSPSNAR